MLQNIILPVFGAALVPMILVFIWYHPKVFGNVWMQAADMNESKMQGANMPLIFGVSFLLSVFLVAAVTTNVIHQTHLFSILADEPGFQEKDPNSKAFAMFMTFMEAYGNNFRTFKHGALHGFLAGIFFVLPVLGTNALFERKGFKYILVNVGYWAVTLMLMGGILCQFLKVG